ncbi:MAG TPA: disulfide bond formation protein B [Candidatus Paceibacterota bacterium]
MNSIIDNFIAASVITSQALIVLCLLGLLLRKRYPDLQFVKLLSKNGFALAFLVALGSAIGSLYYSEIRGFEPCFLCWFQRIAMYPLVVLLGFALLRKEYFIKFYALVFAIVGLIISAYQLALPFLGDTFAPCSALAVSCAKIYVFYLGYITIPLMGFSAFALIILALLLWKKAE